MKKKFMNQELKVLYRTTEPIPPLICQMAVPTIISMLVTNFYNMADTFFVGKINTQSTAAVGVVFSIMALIQAVGFFFGHGSGNYISKKLGAKKFEDASKMAATGFFYAFFVGILICVIGLIFLEPLSVMLGSTPTILPYTKDYLSIILIGTPFIMSSFVLNNQLRYQGSASIAMAGIVTGAVINIGLDPILIFGFNMGISGAAVATTVSQIISFMLLLWGCQKGQNIGISIKKFTPGLYYIKEIFKGGFPSLCRQGLASVAQIALNFAAGIYGGAIADAAIAGMSVVSRVSMFANSALIGFGQGFQPVCGMNYGAKKYDRVREAFWFCVKYAFIFLVIVSIIGVVFARPIVTIFRKDDIDVINIGAFALKMQAGVFFLNAWIVMSNMMLQSLGKAFKASVVAASRQGLFFLPLIFILPRFFGLTGVQICQPISDIFTLIVSIPLTLGVLRELKYLSKQNEKSI